jgi:drug/metabolite transporter (DMT)-like permease
VVIPFQGEILSVLAAVFWAYSVVLFRKSGDHLSPIALNLYKNMIGLVLFGITLLVMGLPLCPKVPTGDLVMLVGSGVIGMAIADTLFLRCLNLLGAGRSQIVSLLYSPFVILLAFFFLDERITLTDTGGTLLILGGVLITSSGPSLQHSAGDIKRGTIIGAFAFFMMAVGVLLMKPLLGRESLIWVTTVRLFYGTVALVIYTLVIPSRRRVWKSLLPRTHWRVTLPPAITGTYLAMLVWMGGMKYTDVSIAAVLNQTSAVFVLPFAAFMLAEPITRRKVAALLLALAGVLIVLIF